VNISTVLFKENSQRHLTKFSDEHNSQACTR